MNRKNFLAALLPLAAAPFALAAKNKGSARDEKAVRIPPYLKTGDTIGICCVAGFISAEDIVPAVLKLQEWGYKVRTGDTIGKKDFTFGGTDAERLHDFQQMLDDDEIKAILCARGGYGTLRIIDKINFKKFTARPKWIIGFSDATVLHSHIHRNCHIATIHSKMCNSFPKSYGAADPSQLETIESIHACLSGSKLSYTAVPNIQNKNGSATGVLVGGNLKTLESLAGSASDINTAGKILFVEDTGEYMYSIDRMFWNLERSGKLSRLKGLIVGGFNLKLPDNPEDDFGKTLEEIVLEKVTEYGYPVCFDFPVGHQKNNFALTCGVKHQLNVTTGSCTLNKI